jgi:hypothetical protein
MYGVCTYGVCTYGACTYRCVGSAYCSGLPDARHLRAAVGVLQLIACIRRSSIRLVHEHLVDGIQVEKVATASQSKSEQVRASQSKSNNVWI